MDTWEELERRLSREETHTAVAHIGVPGIAPVVASSYASVVAGLFSTLRDLLLQSANLDMDKGRARMGYSRERAIDETLKGLGIDAVVCVLRGADADPRSEPERDADILVLGDGRPDLKSGGAHLDGRR